MSTYGLKGHTTPVSTTENKFGYCPKIQENCCTPDDEERIVNYWYTDNKHRIEKYYENFLYAIKFLLGYGIQVEQVAKRVKEDSNFGARNCTAAADDFLELNLNAELIKEVFFAIVEALEKVSDLRRGIPSSLFICLPFEVISFVL